MVSVEKVSVHGGHSGQFCNHATGSLEEIVQEYIEQGFSWVGITEHAPAISEDLLYPDQQELGLTPRFLFERFARYMEECRRLQQKYASRIRIFAAMEIETYHGYQRFVPHLIKTFAPDYLVGSVHFVNEMNFDYSQELYEQVAASVGGIDALYCSYFDQQYEMISLLKPAVVGHFDLVRIFDHEYRLRLEKPEIWGRILRNLELIDTLGLIMDLNLRALCKGADEPYISASILKAARSYNIAVVPGDDSHSIGTVGNFWAEGISVLRRYGFTTKWPQPCL